MATLKPRITITLAPHRHELLRRVAALQGMSMSAVVVDLIETVAEPLERVGVILEAAKNAPQQMKDGLKAATDAAERELLPLQQQASQQLDFLLHQVAEVCEPGATAALAGAAPGRTRPGKALDPRPVITGVRSRGGKPSQPVAVRVSGVLNKKGVRVAKPQKKGGA